MHTNDGTYREHIWWHSNGVQRVPCGHPQKKAVLTVVSTNDPTVVEDSINTMERLLAMDDKYKVVGFDLVYTGGHAGHDQKVVVAELCVRHNVLLYHYWLATRHCKHLTRFVNNLDYRLDMMDTTNDPRVLETSVLACQKLVDIHTHYRVWGSNKDKESLVDLAMAIIDLYYKDMKAKSK
ncbi:Serine/threonine-protein kinase [Hordeum vulgare]|nr:Serine/threonine-protein kinase [Hordeum vulgare]